MNARTNAGEIHERAWELIPWLVNGRLEDGAEPWLSQHVGSCEECRREIEAQKTLATGFTADARVEYAPQASFEKLATRIREFEDAESHGTGRHDRPRPTPAVSMPRWLTATLAMQGAFVIALTVLVGFQAWNRMLEPNYRTLTSVDPSIPASGNLRLVLAPAATLHDFESIVAALKAQVIAGPSSAHVWTLAVPYAADTPQFAELLRRLRADERVTLAEPVARQGTQ